MKKIRVNLAERSYNIIVAKGAIKKLPEVIKSISKDAPVVVITDKVVAKKASRVISPVLKRLGSKVIKVAVPSSERSKSLKVFKDVTQTISKKTKTHLPIIVAIGGGVVGDLAGFVAATYRRGVPLIQVPTTLLAQVDSSVGGKVGVDLPEAKNLIGSFHQPKAVLMDPAVLNTLPKRQIRNGMAEVIKYGIIKSPTLFKFLEENSSKIMALEAKHIEKIVSECAGIKARVVEKDELDCKDVRIILNFGHTLGHAIEAASHYSRGYNHGESVAIGMVLAGEIALKLKMLKEKDLDRIKKIMKTYGFSMRIKGVSVKEIMASCGYDKKFTKGMNRFVLPRRIGSVDVIENIPTSLIKTILKKYVG